MDDVLLQSLKAEFCKLRKRLSEVEEEVLQLRRIRDAGMDVFRQVRWCITCLPAAEDEEEPEYPDSGNVFPIKFVDAHFDATAGAAGLSKTERSEEAVTVAYCAHYVPIGTTSPVFWLRGLGAQDAGEWWLMDMGTPIFRGLTDGEIDKGSSGNVKRFNAGTTTPSDATDTVFNDYINVGDEKIVHYAADGDRFYLLAVECPPI